MISPRTIRWDRFVQAVDEALARGYAYGRIDAYGAKPGPMVLSGEFIAAVRDRGVTVGGFPALYEELQALEASGEEAA